MQINPPDPISQTIILTVIMVAAILLTAKLIKGDSLFSQRVTNQLKGLAILAIIFSHIGYFLSSDDRFLFPLSILAGVGVNIFLLLSGFGLTMSAINRPLSPINFYKRRLGKIFVPLWVIITLFFVSDFLLLHKSYSILTVVQNYLGFYPRANLFLDLDSPLWYFTLIMFYYLTFPFLFRKRPVFLTPALILLVSYIVLFLPLPVDPGVFGLYKVHTLAFPLGVALAQIFAEPRAKTWWIQIKTMFRNKKMLRISLQVLSLAVLLWIIGYTAIYSGVGKGSVPEQFWSIVTTLAIILAFLISRFDSKIFGLFGLYSYEIYLFHWPILYRYDLIYKILPAYLATIIYLVIFVILGYLLQKLVKRITEVSTSGVELHFK